MKKFYNSMKYYCTTGKHYWGNKGLNLNLIFIKICPECYEKEELLK